MIAMPLSHFANPILEDDEKKNNPSMVVPYGGLHNNVYLDHFTTSKNTINCVLVEVARYGRKENKKTNLQ